MRLNSATVDKFKTIVKKYWYIAIPVHIGTSTAWFAGVYTAVKSGLDFVPALEKAGLPNDFIEPIKKGNLGNLAQALVLYKIATPFRYATTLAVAVPTIKTLKRRGMIK